MFEQCEKCKHKEILNGGIVGCLYMGTDCHKGEMFDPITNADLIRAMSDEELAEMLANETYRIAKPCFDAFGYGLEKQVIYAKRLEWLKQPAEKDGI